MRNIFVLMLTTTFVGIATAQQSLPSGTMPFNGEISMRYFPNYEARCTAKSSAKKEVENITLGVSDSSPQTSKLYMVYGGNGRSMRIALALNEKGTGFSSDDAEIEADQPFRGTVEEQASFTKFFGNMLKGALESGFEQPLRMGSVKRDFCSQIPVGRTLSKSGQFVVVGTAEMNGRSSIIYSGEIKESCTLDGMPASVKRRGWEAFDRQSGLPAGSSIRSEISDGKTVLQSATTDTLCLISGSPSQTSITPSPKATGTKTIEQRLAELKSLLDKGLITQDQYQKKSTEVIESL